MDSSTSFPEVRRLFSPAQTTLQKGHCTSILYQVIGAKASGKFSYMFAVRYSFTVALETSFSKNKEAEGINKHYQFCFKKLVSMYLLNDAVKYHVEAVPCNRFIQGTSTKLEFKMAKKVDCLHVLSPEEYHEQVENSPEPDVESTEQIQLLYRIQYDKEKWLVVGKEKGVLPSALDGTPNLLLGCHLVPLKPGYLELPEVRLLPTFQPGYPRRYCSTSTVTKVQVGAISSTVNQD
mmetsp:Transcript_23111/g.28397  ORF Transcript_23111/g.28397 Transcript_23111/m.28397 type:complete len:235 (+) Transcript_23111:476-1180(+)